MGGRGSGPGLSGTKVPNPSPPRCETLSQEGRGQAPVGPPTAPPQSAARTQTHPRPLPEPPTRLNVLAQDPFTWRPEAQTPGPGPARTLASLPRGSPDRNAHPALRSQHHSGLGHRSPSVPQAGHPGPPPTPVPGGRLGDALPGPTQGRAAGRSPAGSRGHTEGRGRTTRNRCQALRQDAGSTCPSLHPRKPRGRHGTGLVGVQKPCLPARENFGATSGGNRHSQV